MGRKLQRPGPGEGGVPAFRGITEPEYTDANGEEKITLNYSTIRLANAEYAALKAEYDEVTRELLEQLARCRAATVAARKQITKVTP